MNNFSVESFLEGKILLIDKPLDWTSFDVVNKIRYAIKKEYNLRKIKVGHAGTLDPLASGLLILCTGKATRRINEYMAEEKEYTGDIFLGGTTPTYDLESQVDQSFPIDHINQELIESKKEQFLGEILQKPPVYSAIRLKGEKAYELARRGEEVEMPSRNITIKELEFGKLNGQLLPFRVVCSKGTYIRSLAHDLGKALSSGAYLASLRRTRIGEFLVDDAMGPLEFSEMIQSR